MNNNNRFIMLLFIVLLLTGCATGKLSDFISKPEKIPKNITALKITNIYMLNHKLIICIKGEKWDGSITHNLPTSMTKPRLYMPVKKVRTFSTSYININEPCSSIVSDPDSWGTKVNTLKDLKLINEINKNPLISPKIIKLKEEAYVFNENNYRKILIVNERNIFFGANYLYVNVPNKYIELKDKNPLLGVLYVFSPITAIFDLITLPFQYIMALGSH